MDVMEKLKGLLLGGDWRTVSIYRSENEIFVYVDGEQKLRMPIEPEKVAESEPEADEE